MLHKLRLQLILVVINMTLEHTVTSDHAEKPAGLIAADRFN